MNRASGEAFSPLSIVPRVSGDEPYCCFASVNEPARITGQTRQNYNCLHAASSVVVRFVVLQRPVSMKVPKPNRYGRER